MTFHKPSGDSQSYALFFVVWGTLTVVLASMHGWKELNTLGAGICGAGIQAFVSVVNSTKEP